MADSVVDSEVPLLNVEVGALSITIYPLPSNPVIMLMTDGLR